MAGKGQPKPRQKQSKVKSIGTPPLVLALGGALIAVGTALALLYFVRHGDGKGVSVGILHKRACSRYGSPVNGCTPVKGNCGRVVHDNFATAEEVASLQAIAARGMKLGGGAGGPTVLDLQSGALSYKDKFIDVWHAFNTTSTPPFHRSEVAVYAHVVDRIRQLAEKTFGVAGLHLTEPTFFSRISADKPPITQHDEYWHVHVDLRQYGSFVFTALLYLSDVGQDFEGGMFEFMEAVDDPPRSPPLAAVAPARGRLVLFTSGDEHPHRVTEVTAGTRLALTIAFTCNAEAGIQNFLGRAVED